MPTPLTRAGAAVLAVAAVAAVADTGAAIYAEYQFSRHVRAAAALQFDPWVAILGFPFTPQAARHRYDEVEIKAAAVPHPVLEAVTLEATMHRVGLTQASWLLRPGADIPTAKLESRIIIDSRRMGAYLGIEDLGVAAPEKDTNDPTGGTTESGISGDTGLVFTGTPPGLDEPVSVTVDLSMAGPDRTTLVLTPTGVATGPGTADRTVPAERAEAVIGSFGAVIPGQRLPFGLAPTAQGARGSDVIIEGVTADATIRLDGFRQSEAARR